MYVETARDTLLLQVSATDGATLLLGDTVLKQAKGSTVVAGFRTFTAAGGRPVAQRTAKTGTTGNTLSWLFTNVEGTVDVTSNATTGATLQSYRDPFGASLSGSAQAWADGTGYMNKPVASSIKLTTVGARVYDPALGKFLSVDPVIDTNLPQQNTGYTYSGNNPTTYTDPTGLRLDEGCGWAQQCVAAKASRRATYTQVSALGYKLLDSWSGSPLAKRITRTIAKHDHKAQVEETVRRGIDFTRNNNIWSGVAMLWQQSTVEGALAFNTSMDIRSQFQSNGEWDAKPYIKKKYGVAASDPANSFVGDSNRKGLVRVDVFGNVNYGYMMAKFGLSLDTTLEASHGGSSITGRDDNLDDKAISLGYQMALDHPDGISMFQYQDIIF